MVDSKHSRTKEDLTLEPGMIPALLYLERQLQTEGLTVQDSYVIIMSDDIS
jgi:hypothetical protein